MKSPTEQIQLLREALHKTCPDCGFGRPVRDDGYHLQLPNEVEYSWLSPSVTAKCRLTPGLRAALAATEPTPEGYAPLSRFHVDSCCFTSETGWDCVEGCPSFHKPSPTPTEGKEE